MVKVYAIAQNDALISILDKGIEDPAYQVNWVSSVSTIMEKLQADDHSIVYLPFAPSYDVYGICEKITKQYPLTTTLLVFHSEEEVDMKRAIRSGASDVIFLATPLTKIREDIKHAIAKSEKKMSQQPQMKSTKNAKVITVSSTKGGVGKTTVAVNLAASYGKKMQKVAVIDLDLQFGDVALFMDVKPKRTIYDWIKEDRAGKQIESFMTPYKNGISILAAPQRPEFAEVITGDYVRKAIHSLKQQYDVVIIDASSNMDETVIVALENSDHILAMTYMDLPTLKNSKLLVDTLDSLQMGDRTKVVLNRNMKVKGMKTETVEKVMGREIFMTIPAMEKLMVTAVNEGKPVTYSNPRSQVSKKIFQMAETLYNPEVRKPNKRNKKQKVKHVAHAGGHA
ncbi:CpaE family protein [Virgibacillus byunsanensis]|uniref:CpaE family protein n=1 Tax=Virgibacillus byunsanensis TaxID=570945 RepID=A0ABW3LLL4_9BACI